MNHRGTEARRDSLTDKVLGAAVDVHRALGPGLLESAYEECLCYGLMQQGLRVQRQAALPAEYKTISLDCGYRMDLLVEDTLVIELKTVEKELPVHQAQLLTCLKLSGLHTGLLLNFPVLRQGIKRMKL